jgi:hypothetical protein
LHAWIATRARENDWDLSERAFGTIDIVLLCEASKWGVRRRRGPILCRILYLQLSRAYPLVASQSLQLSSQIRAEPSAPATETRLSTSLDSLDCRTAAAGARGGESVQVSKFAAGAEARQKGNQLRQGEKSARPARRS